LFKEKFDVTKDEEFSFYEPPNRNIVDAFDSEQDGARGPNPGALKFDFDNDASTLWNQRVARYLLEEMKAYCVGEKMVIKDGYLKRLISEKFNRCRTYWNQAKTRIVDGKEETLDEVESRMVRTKFKRGIAARHRERRVKVSIVSPSRSITNISPQKYDRRMNILSAIIDGESHLNVEELVRWEWLKKVIERLGVDGMSSDESDVESDAEGIQTVVYRVKKLRWRRRIDDELDFIDKARDFVKGVGGRGATPGLRRRDIDNKESNREPVPNLPVAFYDPDWFDSHNSNYRELVVHPSTEEFRWFKLAKSFGKRRA
jgi:hypothetical protein